MMPDLVPEIELLGRLATVCVVIRKARAANRLDRATLLKQLEIIQQKADEQRLRIGEMICELRGDDERDLDRVAKVAETLGRNPRARASLKEALAVAVHDDANLPDVPLSERGFGV